MRNMNEPTMSETENTAKQPIDKPLTGQYSRREFLKLSAILTGSTLLLVNGCGYLENLNQINDLGMPPLPAEFKRFVLTRTEFGLEQPKLTEIALGSQHQNLQVSLLAYDQAELLIFKNVQDVLNSYAGKGEIELHWLD